jgi:hypothetical protein
MVLFKTLNDDGLEVEHYIDGYLKTNLDEIKDSVLNKGWDYIAVVSGIPGVGKSTLAQTICKYLDPTFNTKDRICFNGTGEEGLVQRTTNGSLGQAYMLDESFETMNTKVSRSSEFVRIMNHLQLIRQKGLFIILCLPNFFDLNKGIAIFRTTHLFVVYHDNFKRGYFGAFGRDGKRILYVKGNKYVDYNCIKPNFKGRFTKEWIANQKQYDELKLGHLQSQSVRKAEEPLERYEPLHNLIKYMRENGKSTRELAELTGLSQRWVQQILRKDGEKEEENSE